MQKNQNQHKQEIEKPILVRHDGDTPHLNPDGTDDRDDLPTEGRSLKIVENALRESWFKGIKYCLQNDKIVDEKLCIFYCIQLCKGTIDIYKSYFKENSFDDIKDEWVEEFGKRLGIELFKEIEKITLFTDDSLDSNIKLAKICNVGTRSCINYIRFLFIDKHGLVKKWVVNSNICGHKGRIKEFIAKDKFKIGNTELRFPGEKFNLNCDCSITVGVFSLLESNKEK